MTKYMNVRTRRWLCAWLLMLCALVMRSQGLDSYINRLETFGKSLQQEKVFVHMDNTNYFVGDTLWFKAYTVLSNGTPSTLSGLLYVELLSPDGFLVERENIKLEQGQGSGCFVLTDSLYAGYYELRAYTRWQLNWGITEHPHTRKTKDWFYSQQFEKDFFRDYDKLYSRVFPVYDKPKQPGAYSQDMTLRPLRRYFKVKYEKPQADVSFYPEGGHLVKGTRQRIAFEANDMEGKHLKGKLVVTNKEGQIVAEAPTESRGRGVVELNVTDERLKAEFQWDENHSQAELPKAVEHGVTMTVTMGDSLSADLQCVGHAAADTLGVTVMMDGMLCHYQTLAASQRHRISVPQDKLKTGVAQLTVFNADGIVWADRLVFIRKGDFNGQNITFTGVTDDAISPFDAVTLGVKGPEKGTVSIAVRDANHSEYTFDSGTILTEMLLASQIKGFVEQPEYYFESNDEEHQRALDLLLMVQGWRRHNWTEMAVPNKFAIGQPYEHTPWIYGSVHQYEPLNQQDEFSEDPSLTIEINGENYDSVKARMEYPLYMTEGFIKKWKGLKRAVMAADLLYYSLGKPKSPGYDTETWCPLDDELTRRIVQRQARDMDERRKVLRNQYEAKVSDSQSFQLAAALNHEVTLHAEFITPGKASEGNTNAVYGDMLTFNKGLFRIQAPKFYNYCRLYCAASNHKKWKNGNPPQWMQPAELRPDIYGNGDINYPEYYVRFNLHYPRFVKPYSYYQARMNLSPRRLGKKLVRVDEATLMNEVIIGANHGGLKSFDITKPALVLDAQDAFNATCDAGLCAGYYVGATDFINNIARTYIMDMNMERNYEIEPRYSGRNTSFEQPPGVMKKYNHLHNLDKVYVYTDYAPRREGDKRYRQANQPMVTVDLRIPKDGTQYATYRDRRIVLWGFSSCDDFYHVDYSKRPLPSTPDHRRTLYWNPDLQLDDNGQATVTFYNNAHTTQLTISAEGISPNGTLMTGTSYPEDR